MRRSPCAPCTGQQDALGRFVFGAGFGGNEDLATTEEAGIDGEGAGPEKTECDRGGQADGRGAGIETRQHDAADRRDEHERIAHGNERAAQGRKNPYDQCDAAEDQTGRWSSAEEVGVSRRDEEPRLRRDRNTDISAEQQEAEACPMPWIIQNASAP
jgi:hypothetical protein